MSLNRELPSADVDDDLRRARLLKMITETALIAVTTLVYAKVLLSDDLKAGVGRRIRRWRNKLFGPPPLTEEEIKEAERQVVIEAMRTVRYG